MIGCTVNASRRSGARVTRTRLRSATTSVSATTRLIASTRLAAGRRRPWSDDAPSCCHLLLVVVFGALGDVAGQRQEPVVGRRASQRDVVDVDARLVQPAHRL